MNRNKKLGYISIVLLVIAILGFLFIYRSGFSSNVTQRDTPYSLLISENFTLDSIIYQLTKDKVLKDSFNFKLISKALGYNQSSIKQGHYLLKGGMNNYQLVIKLRSGNQDPIKVTINNVRDIYQLCGKLDSYLRLDSLRLIQYFTDSTQLKQLGYNKENILSLFIPNTYEMYWTTSLEKFVQKMQMEHQKFWSKENRTIKAAAVNLKPEEIYTLASIVEKETIKVEERPTIAGVYLNRLNQSMKLQADPTVVFALGLNGIQRVLLEHLRFESSYNTYLNEGLPPGPIYMPSLNSIDAVLNAEKHDFIFFCAKPGSSGTHSFASSLKQHYENARLYQKWMNESQIK